MSERAAWPLWQCLPDETIIKLILYQWDNYGLKLELLADIYADWESLEEIDQLMRQAPRHQRRVA